MDDLMAWLGAQLDEDERVALAIEPDERRWEWEPDAETVRSAGGSYVACGPWSGPVTSSSPLTLVRWDPTRVLAEVEAKRAILHYHMGAATNPQHYRHTAAVAVLRCLTLPYRDRPGFNPEWAAEAARVGDAIGQYNDRNR